MINILIGIAAAGIIAAAVYRSVKNAKKRRDAAKAGIELPSSCGCSGCTGCSAGGAGGGCRS